MGKDCYLLDYLYNGTLHEMVSRTVRTSLLLVHQAESSFIGIVPNNEVSQRYSLQLSFRGCQLLIAAASMSVSNNKGLEQIVGIDLSPEMIWNAQSCQPACTFEAAIFFK